jgi:hypothetical protein
VNSSLVHAYPHRPGPAGLLGIGLGQERYAIPTLHALSWRQFGDVKENVRVTAIGLDESERIAIPKHYLAFEPIIFVSQFVVPYRL